jgi:hypothetical protein
MERPSPSSSPDADSRRLNAPYLVLHVAVPLLIGGGIYLLWRDPSLLMFRWTDALWGSVWLDPVRQVVSPARPFLPDWLLFSVPDGAWVYAYVAFFGRLWREGPAWARHFWTWLGPALAIGGELGQIVGWVPGTWDPLDVVWYIIAAAVAVSAAWWGRP